MAAKPSEDIERYKKALTESGLVKEEDLDDVLTEMESDFGNKPTDSMILSQRLLEQGMVTPWQNQHLMDGRKKGFFLGRYKLLGHLGSGGMSTVYLAEHVHMRRRVAIKVLAEVENGNSSRVSRFFTESQAIANLNHPNIVRAHDFDSDGKFHYLVMEYIDGPDVQKYVETVGPLPYDTAADFIRQAAAGLAHAHERGNMVHRDIKPANLLLENNETVKILDMGVARMTNATESLTVEQGIDLVGTVDYLSPEQALDSHEVDARADIYSLGCTLYYCLTGHAPFPSGSQAQRLLKHQMEQPSSVLKERPDAPQSLLDICLKMMAKLPANRYQTARETEAALAEWLESRGNASGILTPADRSEPSELENAISEPLESGSTVQTEPAAPTELKEPGDPAKKISSPLICTISGTDDGTVFEKSKPAAPGRVQFCCDRCGSSIKAPVETIGRRGTCPKCQQRLIVPTIEVSQRMEALQTVIENFIEAAKSDDRKRFRQLIRNLVLPKHEAWLQKVFGAKRGIRVAAEYEQQVPRLENSLIDFFNKIAARGKTELRIRRVERPSPDETQQIIRTMQLMEEPVVVYAARFAAPDETMAGSITLACFFYVKHEFRLLGPMKSLE